MRDEKNSGDLHVNNQAVRRPRGYTIYDLYRDLPSSGQVLACFALFSIGLRGFQIFSYDSRRCDLWIDAHNSVIIQWRDVNEGIRQFSKSIEVATVDAVDLELKLDTAKYECSSVLFKNEETCIKKLEGAKQKLKVKEEEITNYANEKDALKAEGQVLHKRMDELDEIRASLCSY